MPNTKGRETETCRITVAMRINQTIEVSLDDDTRTLCLFHEAYKNLSGRHTENVPVMLFVDKVEKELTRRSGVRQGPEEEVEG